MSDRDERYRQQRDKYRAALVDVAAVAILGGVTAATDWLPGEPGLRTDVQRRVRDLAAEVDRLSRMRA